MNEQSYWIVELRPAELSVSWAACYYTSPGTWSNAIDLATKFHTEVAASFEAQHLQIPGKHKVVALQHMWVDV